MKTFLFAAVLLAAVPAMADETIQLKAGNGMEMVQSTCSACHSVDYIVMNSPFLDRAKWEASVVKMKKVFKAVIDDKDVPTIVDYLTAQYGPAK
ncbi:MAG: photosystem P840 reaction-center cytochrome c-551 [Alphaproteobacteria bacterium]|nr:photosystem P840 reaction-center cytochrome c-551 [Alphaproteobacteria bacterium]